MKILNFGSLNVDYVYSVDYFVQPGETIPQLLREKFPKAAVLLTLGEKGSVYHDGIHREFQPAYNVKTLDTTAAGDTFTGYFIAARAEESALADCLSRAAKAAAIAISRKGASVSIPHAEEVDAFHE